jgi:hypothetical protein
LIANFQLERQFRRTYLMSLRDSLRNEDLTSLTRADPLTGLARAFRI